MTGDVNIPHLVKEGFQDFATIEFRFSPYCNLRKLAHSQGEAGVTFLGVENSFLRHDNIWEN
jgi:hypothetical protein